MDRNGRSRELALGLALILAPLVSCGDDDGRCGGVVCGPCPPPVSIAVQDAATGDPVDGLTLESDRGQATCTQSVCGLLDSTFPFGTYSVTLSAEGYVSQRIEVEVPRSEGQDCCDCGYVGRQLDVALEPVG